MQVSQYVALSGQIAAVRQLDAIANNVANANTVGFRADNGQFRSIVHALEDEATTFAVAAQQIAVATSGSIVKTGAPLDLAVNGDAWFAVETPAGRGYTRDGRFQVGPDGMLRNLSGHPVLDPSGTPIQLAMAAGTVEIARDGAISQQGRQLGSVGLFALDPQARVSRAGEGVLFADRPARPVVDFTTVSVAQGFVEGSNVKPMQELSKLIALQRLFDATTRVMSLTDAAMAESIRTLGPPG